MNYLTKSFLCAGLAGGIAFTANAQMLVSDNFQSYSSTAEMQANWGVVGSGNAGTLDLAFGNPAPSGFHDGTAAANSWIGSSISVTPTNENPLILRADLYYTGVIGQRNSVGLRTTPYGGGDPLFEVGFNNNSPQANGLGVRHIGIGGPSTGANDWNEIASYAELGTGEENAVWIRTVSTFITDGVIVTFDVGINGTTDYTMTSLAANAGYQSPFTDLRWGGISSLSSAAGAGFNVDNISLEVIPEPSTYAAIFGALALAGVMLRRRLMAKK